MDPLAEFMNPLPEFVNPEADFYSDDPDSQAASCSDDPDPQAAGCSAALDAAVAADDVAAVRAIVHPHPPRLSCIPSVRMVELLHELGLLTEQSALRALQSAVSRNALHVAARLLDLAVDPNRECIFDISSFALLADDAPRKHACMLSLLEWALVAAETRNNWLADILIERGACTGFAAGDPLHLARRLLSTRDASLFECALKHAQPPRPDLSMLVAAHGTCRMLEIAQRRSEPFDWTCALDGALRADNTITALWLIDHGHTALKNRPLSIEKIVNNRSWIVLDRLLTRSAARVVLDPVWCNCSAALGFVLFCTGKRDCVYLSPATAAGTMLCTLERKFMLEHGLQGAAALAFIRDLFCSNGVLLDVLLKNIKVGARQACTPGILARAVEHVCSGRITAMAQDVVHAVLSAILQVDVGAHCY